MIWPPGSFSWLLILTVACTQRQNAVTFKIICRFFKFICRWLDMLLDGANHEALPGRVYDFPRYPRQRIDLHQAGDLSQQTVQQAEIAARDPDDGR